MDSVKYYKALRKDPQRVHEFMDYVTDHLIEFANRQIDAGADVIAVSDPSGTGEIMGPKFFKEFTVQYLNKFWMESKTFQKLFTYVEK